jgi:hypothetical protein
VRTSSFQATSSTLWRDRASCCMSIHEQAVETWVTGGKQEVAALVSIEEIERWGLETLQHVSMFQVKNSSSPPFDQDTNRVMSSSKKESCSKRKDLQLYFWKNFQILSRF